MDPTTSALSPSCIFLYIVRGPSEYEVASLFLQPKASCVSVAELLQEKVVINCMDHLLELRARQYESQQRRVTAIYLVVPPEIRYPNR